jgi:putative hydrolase of the HAD superfamily
MSRVTTVLFDLGDTLIIEQSEVKDSNLTTLSADLIEGVESTLLALRAQGINIGLVADTKSGTYKNVLSQHGLFDLFGAFAISDELNIEKPDPRMFRSALDAMGISPDAYRDVVMVGNNLQRDIKGANAMGV